MFDPKQIKAFTFDTGGTILDWHSGFSKGFEQTTEELFGEDSNISKVLNVVFLPLLTNIGDGFKAIADILDPPEGKKPLDLL